MRRLGRAPLAGAAMVVAIGMLLIAATVRLASTTGPESVRAVVDVGLYSGKPDPRAALSAARTGELLDRLAALPPTDRTAGIEPLGYRGLRVQIDGPGGVTDIIVFDELVRVTEPDGSDRRLADPGRGLERWLLDQLRPQLTDDEAGYLGHELGG